MCRVLQAKLLIFFPGNLLAGNRTVVRAEEISQQGGQMGADCKRFTDWALLFRLPEIESAPKPLEKVIHSPPHSLWTANNAVGRGVRTRPPVAEFQRVCPYTPQQKIFAKVRSA
jgi:hypothetical protein